MNVNKNMRQKYFYAVFLFFWLCLNLNFINCDSSSNFKPFKECPREKPVQEPLTGECVMKYCKESQYKNLECNITNPVIKKQYLSQFLYEEENSVPIHSSFGTNDLGDIYFQSGLGDPFSKQTIFTLKENGREYIDGIKRNTINSGNNMFSKFGTGEVVTINDHKCYLKLSANESLEMYDFDDKKYTFANLKEKLGGYEIKSEKNSLIRMNIVNTYIYAFITSDNYLMMIKFKIVSNDANNCIQIIKTLKEDIKSIPTNIRTCMITKNQYIECLDITEDQMYVIRIYTNDLKFLKQYELEKNNAVLEKAIHLYHECVWLKDEISIFVYYTDITENNARPIVVLKKLTVKSSQVTLNNLNSYLIRDTLFKNMEYEFSDTENSLAIFNSYYFGITSLAIDKTSQTDSQHLIIALANIFNDDKTIDNHYFDIPLSDLYDINYQSGLRAFGYKNAYGVQMNYIHNNKPTSGFIVFGYANTTDPDSINNLFDKYDSYTIKVKDYYKGIENNLFCYEFINMVITKIPSSTYFSVKTSSNKVLKVGSTLTLNDEITITKVKGKTAPTGRYVLAIAPYLNEADYKGFTDCSVDRDMFGEQVPTNWYPDEFYGRTIEFKFTVGIDCHENCLTCNEKGTEINNQKCTACKSGYYFIENSNNCFGEIPEGYYFNETKKTYMECFESCKICSKKREGNNHNCKICKDNYILIHESNCFNCKKDNKYLNYEQTECINNVPDGYYINDTQYNTIDKCFEKCKTCNETSSNEENMKCLSCDNEKGLYLKEGTNNCISDSEIKEGEYLDTEDNIIKKCNLACKSCSSKEILNADGDIINCDSCNNDKGYYLIKDTSICTNRTIEDFSVETTEQIIVKKCHENCLTCIDSPIEEQEMNCLTCDNTKGYYIIKGTNNCEKVPYQGYYLKENELNKCYEDCLTCSEGPLINEENIVINMNCDSCDGAKELILNKLNKNCEFKNIINNNTEIILCPREKPILKEGKCVSEYCSYEQYENKECIINNPIIKDQWIYEYPYFSNLVQPYYSTLAQNSNDDLVLESNIGSPNSSRNFYALNEDSKGYFDGTPEKVIHSNSDLFSTNGNGALLNINGNKNFMKLSNYETLEMFDFDEDKFTLTKLEEKLGYKVESSKNSLLLTNEENTFIYAYITVGNHLIMTKFKIVSNDADNCMQIIKTSLEDFVTTSKSSRRCLITENQYIECLDIDENKNYVIRLYNSDLDFLRQYKLDEINSSLESLYDIYHEAIWLGNNISVFAYYNDISNNKAKTNIILKQLKENNDDNIELNDFLSLLEINLYNEINYLISEIENSLAKINEELLVLASLTKNENKHLLLALMEIYNNYKNIKVKYFDIPLKDLYNIDYYGNLKSFGYKNTFGVQFDHKKENEYRSGFIIFSFGNSNDPFPVENIFRKNDTYILNPSNYVKIENNVLCFTLRNIIINGIPNDSSGIIVQRNNENKTRFKNGDLLNINEEIIITYNENILDKSRGNFNISFTPYLKENETNQCFIKEEKFGENESEPFNNREYKGKTFYLQFTVDNCYKNCFSCKEIGTNINDQKCDSCLDNYYFVEGTKNCFEKEQAPLGYYFDENEKKFKKCFENCKTCKDKGTSQNNMKCISCNNDKGYFFFSGTKNCVKMPIPGYYIDKEDKKIKKCDIACATCSFRAILNENNEVINCDTCNKDYGFYKKDGSTICLNKAKEGEYYDDGCNCYKKCYKDCLTCSAGALDRYNMNCLSCDETKGYQFFQKSSNCLNCKYLNKIVNFAQTECISKVPDGYYLNDTDKNTIDECHKNCVKCSGPPIKVGNIENQNCITCQHGLYFKNGNCIKSYVCPYNFFYQAKFDKYADINQKICLDKDEICPCALPFLYTSTNECVENCPLDLILYQGCKISNVPYGLNKVINSIDFSFQQGHINSISKSFVLKDINNLYDILVKITLEKLKNSLKLVRRRIQSLSNYTSINNASDFESSEINLGDCENKLREYYKISDNISLNLIKLEIKTYNSKINHVQYEIFNPYNKTEKLDLSICQKEKVKLINRIDNSLNKEKLSNLLSSSEEKDFISDNSDFYKDYCSKFISEDDAFVLLQDRDKDYNYKGKLCQIGCNLEEINITSGSVTCLCPPNDGIGNISILNIDQLYQEAIINIKNQDVLNNGSNNKESKYSFHNFKALKCIKNIFSSEFSKNYILIIFTVFIFLFLVVMISFFLYKKYKNESISNPPHRNEEKKKSTKSKDKDKDKNKKNDKDKKTEKDKVKKNLKKEVKKKPKYSKMSSGRRLYDSKSKFSEDPLKGVEEDDPDDFEFNLASITDLRTFIQMFISFIKKRQLIILWLNKKNYAFIIAILFLIFSIINFLGINTFFFSEKNIHQIYNDKNSYNFCYQIKYIILSVFISYIIIRLSKFLYNSKNGHKPKFHFIFISIISFPIFLLYWFYVGAITSLYINIKKHLLINTIICFTFENCLEVLLTLIISILRYFGLKKSSEKMYILSKKINYI